MEAEVHRRLDPFQTSNHALTMELTALHVLDQGPRDLFPQVSDGWEDSRGFEDGPEVGTEIRVDGRPRNV